MNIKISKKKGFVLIEVLLTIFFVSLLILIGTGIYQSFQNRNSLDLAQDTIVQSLRRAHLLSQAVANDSSWGVHIQNNNVVIFKGLSYAARDQTYDEVYTISKNITVSGLNEIVFVKFTGIPLTSGSITLTNTNNQSKSIVINSLGIVDF